MLGIIIINPSIIICICLLYVCLSGCLSYEIINI